MSLTRQQVLNYSIALVFFIYTLIASIGVVGDSQPIYKPGDYFVYNVVLVESIQGQTCRVEFKFRLDITRVEYPLVEYNASYIDVKSSGTCPSSLPTGRYSNTVRVDLYPNSTESDIFLVNPSYSGEYKNTTMGELATGSLLLNYNSGVLTSGSITIDAGYIGSQSIKIELVESSIKELTDRANSINPLLWITIVTIVLVATIGAYILIYKKRKSVN